MDRAVTSASNLFRRVLCPGSHHAEAGAPEQADRSFALTGTLLHYKDAMGEEGDKPSQTEALMNNARLRTKFLAELLPRQGAPTSYQPIEIREAEYWVHDSYGPAIPGHPDLILWYPEFKFIVIFDSKFGRKMVPAAENNWQLKHYTVATCDPEQGEFNPERIFCAITQWYCERQLHAAEYTKADVLRARQEILDVWEAVQSPDAPRRPSVEACWMCKGLATCPQGQSHMMSLSKLKISEVPLPELEAMAPRVELCELAAKAYWERLEYIAEHFPHLLKNWELGPGRPLRKVHPIAAYEALMKTGMISAEQFSDCCRVSLTALEEKVAKNLKCGLSHAKTAVADALADTMTVTEGKKILRPKK